MGVTLIKSFDRFSEEKSYAYKLYVVKNYVQKYCVKIWLKEVTCKIPSIIKVVLKKCSLGSYLETKFMLKIYVHQL